MKLLKKVFALRDFHLTNIAFLRIIFPFNHRTILLFSVRTR